MSDFFFTFAADTARKTWGGSSPILKTDAEREAEALRWIARVEAAYQRRLERDAQAQRYAAKAVWSDHA